MSKRNDGRQEEEAGHPVRGADVYLPDGWTTQEKYSNMWLFRICSVTGTVKEAIALDLDRLGFYHVPLWYEIIFQIAELFSVELQDDQAFSLWIQGRTGFKSWYFHFIVLGAYAGEGTGESKVSRPPAPAPGPGSAYCWRQDLEKEKRKLRSPLLPLRCGPSCGGQSRVRSVEGGWGRTSPTEHSDPALISVPTLTQSDERHFCVKPGESGRQFSLFV